MTALASRVRSELLDCVQSNLAVLADRWGEPHRHLALGARLRFRPRPGPEGLPTVDPAPEAHLREGAELTGLATLSVHRSLGPDGLRALTERAQSVYAIGDAYDMPWLPYAGHAHMEHSFLVSEDRGQALVEDAYDNETAWGAARPGRWTLPWDQLPAVTLAVVCGAASGYRAPEPVVDLGDPRRYVEAYATHPDQLLALRRLTAETWLMTRARRLHAAYREHLGACPDLRAHLARWDRLTSTAFIALRRVERGKAAPGSLLPDLASALLADRDAFTADPT